MTVVQSRWICLGATKAADQLRVSFPPSGTCRCFNFLTLVLVTVSTMIRIVCCVLRGEVVLSEKIMSRLGKRQTSQEIRPQAVFHPRLKPVAGYA